MRAQTLTVTVPADVTVPDKLTPSAGMFVPSAAETTTGCPGCAPVTATVPLEHAPARRALPPMLPVVAVIIGT